MFNPNWKFVVLNHVESNSWIHRGKRWFRNPDFTSRYGENIGRSFHEGFIPGGCLGFLNHHLSNQYTIYSLYIYRISYIYIHTSIAPLSRCLLGCFVAFRKKCHLFFPVEYWGLFMISFKNFASPTPSVTVALWVSWHGPRSPPVHQTSVEVGSYNNKIYTRS